MKRRSQLGTTQRKEEKAFVDHHSPGLFDAPIEPKKTTTRTFDEHEGKRRWRKLRKRWTKGGLPGF